MGDELADEPMVDTHVHFWDHSVEGLHWPWLEPGFTHRHLQGTHVLDAPRYSAPEFRAETDGAGVAGVVHTQAAGPMPDPSIETAWLESVGEAHGLPSAIVGACALSEPGAGDLLRRHARHQRFRGVRDIASARHLDVDEVAPALDVAGELGLSVELRRSHEQFAALSEVATRWPHVVVTLSHACLPLDRAPGELAAWSRGMRGLAARPNIACKISAVAGASDPDWTVDSVRPWILACVEAFGADRCMLGSNWPVDRLFGSYGMLVAAYREVLAELDPPERAAVLHRTAERVYRLSTEGDP